MEALEMLFLQATGGGAVAADPGSPLSDYWPRASNAAGVDALMAWHKHRETSTIRTLLFLVGGPGGGKSHVSAELVAEYKELNARRTNLAQRSHLYESRGSEVLLVNDATIAEAASDKRTLAHEINDCLTLNRSLIACINRGILIEELSKDEIPQLPKEILIWLSNSNELSRQSTSMQYLQESSYLKTARHLSEDGQVFEIAVAYVDACSLFENNPKAIFDADANFDAAFQLPPYKLTKWTKREFIEPESMPGLHLIEAVIQTLEKDLNFDDQALSVNPICSNIENLKTTYTARNLCNLLRAAEISTGQRFTYREVWGVIARLVSGDLSRTLRAHEVGPYLQALQPNTDKTPNEEFKKLQELASVRFSQGVFGVENEALLAPKDSAHPITSLLFHSDPVRDGEPGFYKKSEVNAGWITPVLDAFAGSIAGESPLTLLFQHLENNADDNFRPNVTSFDWALDQAFVGYTRQSKLKDEDRAPAINWYSSYLSRLYAVTNGIPAFLQQTASWLEVWLSSPSLPMEIEQRLLTLLRPRRVAMAEENAYIPVFDSRTVPVTELASEAKLVAKLSGMKAKTKVDGDSVILTIEEHGADVAEILFDFPLLRDALSCTTDHVGATDVSALTAPRLERLRASRLAPQISGNKLQIAVLEGFKSSEVIVS